MFEIKNVSKKYHSETALDAISFTMGKGLNFIVGASGSGKTTLLKIISGMEQNFEGEVYYEGKSIKKLTANEKSYFYNNVFGFVWQDFNLLEDLSVLENVLLPQYLKDNQNEKDAHKVLKELEIFELASQKVSTLSGGQKQRVAIARELMKNPQVIIADEPTSALDEETTKTTMAILNKIAKKRTVIIVTHDPTLINENANVLDLDEGEAVTQLPKSSPQKAQLKYNETHRLSIGNAFKLTKMNIKSKMGRFVVSALSLMIAGIFLLTTVSGAIGGSSQEEFEELIDTYGESLTDISLISSFTSASGTDGQGEDKPNGDVSQDINGLYDKYMTDERVKFTTYLQAFDDIKVTVNGQKYQIQSSGNVPVINKLVEGEMPTGKGNEVVVPESFVKTLGLLNEEVIGTEIDFNGSIYNWDTGEPKLQETSIKAIIVGVADATMNSEFEGKMYEIPIEDSFFFSKTALNDLRKQAKIESKAMNFLIRAKTPSDMIAIKDELNEQGIVPLGQFEIVEDIVRLNNQTTAQSGSAGVIIGVLSIIMVIGVSLMTSMMRKREYAIYKVSGFNNGHLSVLNITEKLTEMVSAIVLMLVASPLLNAATKSFFSVDILNSEMLLKGALLIVVVSVVSCFITAMTIVKTNTVVALKTGD